MSRMTELPAHWTACGALRMGNTACAQAVVLARLLGLMHVCLHAYVVAYVCTYPSAVEKKCPLLPLRAVLHELVHVFCFAKFPLE